MGCLVLLLALLLQSAWWVRGDLLSSPLAYRLLDGVCRVLGCPIPLPRRSDQLVVRERYLGPYPEQADKWQLRLGLRNPNPIPLALPVIEVELYDLHEHLISVGRFIPEQYTDPASPQAVAPHTEISLSLLLQAPQPEPSGFRLHLR